MAQYGTGQGHGHPVSPTQNNGFAPWGSEALIPAHHPASQQINKLNGYSYGAPNAVLCQTPDGVAGYMIWHGDPNAFPTVAQIRYDNGPVYPKSCPPQSVGWGPIPPPTPDSSLISTQGFVPRHDPSFPTAQHQPKPGAQNGVPPVPRWETPTPSHVPGVVRSPVTSETIINSDYKAAGAVIEVPQGWTMPQEDAEEADFASLFLSSPKWGDETESLFDFNGASLSWEDESFWTNEDPAQTGQHGSPGHPMMVLRGTNKAPLCLNPWIDDELNMPVWAL